MNRLITVLLAIAFGLTANGAVAQSNDAAAERARIANQRIAAEAARRGTVEAPEATSQPAGPEPAAADSAPANEVAAADPGSELRSTVVRSTRPSIPREPAPAPQPAGAPSPSTAAAASVASGSSSRAPMSATLPAETPATERPGTEAAGISDLLDDLERLGQLKDAGYLTDAEFERIKNRILNGRL